MSAPRTHFAYDEFERFLLDTAKHDRAPQDLPARMGIALGLSVPILVATEMAAALPALTTSAGVAELGGAVAPSGVMAAVKTTWGLGASSLLFTAVKGIAIGVLSGTALLGTGHAVTVLAAPNRNQPRKTATMGANTRALPPLPVVGRALTKLESALIQGTAAEAQADSVTSNPNTDVRTTTKHGVLSTPTASAARTGDEAVRDTVAETSLKPTIPEKTAAIGRFATLNDDVSALYDTPKQPLASTNVPAVKEPETISATDLLALRKATVSRTRTLLGQGKAAQALGELNRFRSRVGAKHFGVDELLLHIEALAELGRAKEAQSDVAIVERLVPASAALRQAQQLARSRFVR